MDQKVTDALGRLKALAAGMGAKQMQADLKIVEAALLVPTAGLSPEAQRDIERLFGNIRAEVSNLEGFLRKGGAAAAKSKRPHPAPLEAARENYATSLAGESGPKGGQPAAPRVKGGANVERGPEYFAGIGKPRPSLDPAHSGLT